LANLIARFAENVYWLGRYLERAENLARIIDINESFARDREDGPTWQRILEVYADKDRFLERYDSVNAESVLHFYILDRENLGSAGAAIAMARENARTIRHLISTEMWMHLNVFHYRMARLTRRDIWLTQVSRTCSDIKTSCQAFEGIAEGTFFRNEAWCFYHLGKYMERADQTTRVLQMGFDQLQADESESLSPIHRGVLLRSVAGYHAFRHRYPSGSTPNEVAKFLLYDDEFPRAVALCVDHVSRRLGDLDRIHKGGRNRSIASCRKALETQLETGLTERITTRRLHRFLDELQVALGDLSAAVSKSYFN
jgi:uncharacterized alpha-E superfamily protein